MFDITAAAELKEIKLRMEVHGDQDVRAVHLKLYCLGVPAERLTSAVPDLRKKFYDKDQPILQEVYPLHVRHSIDNVEANLVVETTGISLVGDVSKIQITPQPEGVCSVSMTLQVRLDADGVLDTLSHWLKSEVALKVFERQIDGLDEN